MGGMSIVPPILHSFCQAMPDLQTKIKAPIENTSYKKVTFINPFFSRLWAYSTIFRVLP